MEVKYRPITVLLTPRIARQTPTFVMNLGFD